jgi:hypothetical protein
MVPEQVGPQHVLGFGTDEDSPLSPVVCRLMRLGDVAPHFALGVNVAWSDHADFAWSATHHSLKPYHVGYHGRKVG